MRVVRYFMCLAVFGSSTHARLAASRSRSVVMTSAHTSHGVEEAAAIAPYDSHNSVRVEPRKGPGAARSAAAAATRCCSLIKRCRAPKPVLSGRVSVSLMNRSSASSSATRNVAPDACGCASDDPWGGSSSPHSIPE